MKPNSGYPETGFQGQCATPWIRTGRFEPVQPGKRVDVRSPGRGGRMPGRFAGDSVETAGTGYRGNAGSILDLGASRKRHGSGGGDLVSESDGWPPRRTWKVGGCGSLSPPIGSRISLSTFLRGRNERFDDQVDSVS